MREKVKRIIDGYKSPKLEGQDEGYVVFSGEEPDTRAAVLIKILPRLLGDDPQIARRFDGLARTIRQLNHPNIASVRKVGEEAGLPYFITRAIEKARPLAVKLDQPWAVDAAADVVMQVGQALEHAYDEGVVHGSLTPENIVVQDDGRVMVTDLGLAEMQDLLGVHLKQAASPFLAPERIAGEAANARSDVYSLGAVLYRMLAKRDPEVVGGEVVPPSRFNPDVPPTMDAVVVRALASDPAQRYPDAHSFLAALGAVTLAPMVKERQPARAGNRCPKCGADKQTGRFCRKCGTRLAREEEAPPAPSGLVLDEPIQVTKVDVDHAGIEVGEGVMVAQTAIATPMSVATGELLNQFPEPLDMPQVDAEGLWPTLGGQQMIAMPEPPSMPVIDWGEIAPPMPEVPSFEDTPVSREDD